MFFASYLHAFTGTPIDSVYQQSVKSTQSENRICSIPWLAGISVVLRPFIQINVLSNNDLMQLLLYGVKGLPSDVKKHVMELTLNFIHKIGWFY